MTSDSEPATGDSFLEVPSELSSEPRSASENGSSSTENRHPARVRRRPIPRKGHTKSRNGCYNCKRRKVKCQENLPECHHCKRIGLLCEYPPTKSAAPHSPSPSHALQTATSPTTFGVDDLRFFQHFILAAYPSLPIGGDSVWRDVTSMAHSYDFLIHAMLGLGASHLTLCAPGNYSSQALDHRVQAIKSLNSMLSKPKLSQVEGDAAFATIMALTFQSSYMPEGMLDFVSMVRGCHIVATKAMPNFEESAFRAFSREGHVESFQKLIKEGGTALKNWGIIDGYLASVRDLAPLCRSTIELNYLAEVQKVIQMAIDGDTGTYGKFATLYNRFGEMTNEDFVIFCDPKNYTSQLLLSHFFLLDYIMGRTGYGENKSIGYRKKITLMWLERTAKHLPQKYLKYIRWPLNFARTVMHPVEPPSPWDEPAQSCDSPMDLEAGFSDMAHTDDASFLFQY